MTCSTPPPMCGAITEPGGVWTTQGADPSMVKYTAPVSRIARSTSESVSKAAEYPDKGSAVRDGACVARGRLEVGEQVAGVGGMVPARRHRVRGDANVVGEVHGLEENFQRRFEARLAAADGQLQLHLERGEQEDGGAVHVGDDVVAIGAPGLVQLRVEGGHHGRLER